MLEKTYMIDECGISDAQIRYRKESIQVEKAHSIYRQNPAAIILNEELYNNFDKERVMGLEEVFENEIPPNEEDLVFQN